MFDIHTCLILCNVSDIARIVFADVTTNIILICVLIYNTIASTVLYNFILLFSLNRAALKNSILLNCVLPCIHIFE